VKDSDGAPMKRYFFDLRDSEGLTVDEEGLELQDVQAAREEAALSLADAARACGSDSALNQMTIEVRTDAGLLMRVSFSFEVAGRN
jgi:Domain of unknown function (DUF6894)